MIDERRVQEMACAYDTNHSTARKLLESAQDVPALRIGRRYREMTGGDAGEPEKETSGHDMGRLRDFPESV